MSFEARHAHRKRILDRIILAAQVVMVLYLAAHAGITYQAYAIDGLLAAVLTFVLLGFGDLYWGVRWAYEGGEPELAAVALVTAAVCFISWTTRGMFNRWATQFTVDMLQDFSSELEHMREETDAPDGEQTPSDETSDRGPPGGGARPLE